LKQQHFSSEIMSQGGTKPNLCLKQQHFKNDNRKHH
jgi:hypothetical protein